MDRGASLVQSVFLHAMTVPALNKWTTVAPTLGLVAAMQQFGELVPRAFRACYPAPSREGPQAAGQAGAAGSESDDAEDEGAALGAPLDQTKVWRRLARKRQKKATLFLSDPEARWSTLLWAVVTFPVMQIHYSLFKRGTWMTERPASENGDASAAVFADADRSPAAKAGELLGNLLADGSHLSWTPMLEPYGPLEGWPQARLRTTRKSILVAVGQLWRKLQEPMLRYPWTLARLDRAEGGERARLAEEFWNAQPCVLDGFSGKLRTLLTCKCTGRPCRRHPAAFARGL